MNATLEDLKQLELKEEENHGKTKFRALIKEKIFELTIKKMQNWNIVVF